MCYRLIEIHFGYVRRINVYLYIILMSIHYTYHVQEIVPCKLFINSKYIEKLQFDEINTGKHQFKYIMTYKTQRLKMLNLLTSIIYLTIVRF